MVRQIAYNRRLFSRGQSMSYSYYDNIRDFPRITKAVFVKYEIRNEMNATISSGIATTKDLSMGGLKFVCSTPVKVGYIVKLEVKLDTFNSIGAVGTVAWVENPKHGQFVVGVKFQPLEEKHKAKILKFLNSFAPKE